MRNGGLEEKKKKRRKRRKANVLKEENVKGGRREIGRRKDFGNS